MANILAELFQNTANAIREKTGESGTMKPAEFPEKIRSITGGGGGSVSAKLIPLTVTENGVYEPPTGEFEVGKTYKMKDSYDTETLQALYAKSIQISEDGTEAMLQATSNGMIGIINLEGMYAVFASQENTVRIWLPEEWAGLAGVASGWYLDDGSGDGTPTEAPSITIGELDMLFVHGGLSALSPLYDLEKADGFSKVSVNVAGSGSAALTGAYTLTFLNHDESFLYEKQTVAGDDSYDPVTAKKIATPTKESTPQNHYTYNGWNTTLKNITSDKTIHATFKAETRYYTVTFYDSDGTTVLRSEQHTYGATPTYIPTKSGFAFVGWTPAISMVTEDTSYVASWSEKPSFAGSSWEDIARISESGKAAESFEIGDKKTIPFGEDTMELVIADFNHDDLADGSGKAGMTIVCVRVTNETDIGAANRGNEWGYNYMENNYMPLFPSEVRAVMKTVTKDFSKQLYQEIVTEPIYYDMKLFGLSTAEMNLTYPREETEITRLGTVYPYFAKNPLKAANFYSASGTVGQYQWTRDLCRSTGGLCGVYANYTAGRAISQVEISSSRTYTNRLAFCV